jgi:hypothetical protein
MYDLYHPGRVIYGLMETGEPAVAVIIGEKAIGEDRGTRFG